MVTEVRRQKAVASARAWSKAKLSVKVAKSSRTTSGSSFCTSARNGSCHVVRRHARSHYLGSLDSAATRRLTPADTAGVYLSSGWLLWVRSGTLVAQRLDLGRWSHL